jgi:hypothetical protein
MRPLMKIVIGLVAAASAGLVQGPPQPPPRDQARSPLAAGSASITGIVVADDEARAPLRHALMTLVRAGTEDMRSTATDERGSFEFSPLPAGSYRLIAAKGAYVSMDYGAPKPGMPGRSIALTDGQAFTTTPIALIRGAVIGGRLLDVNGSPVPNTRVQASQFLTINGGRKARITSGASGNGATNAHGEYRIYGLLPGDYLVHARAPSGAPPYQMTIEALRWARNPAGPAPAPTRPMGYAPTLFPGTSDPASAVPITLARGEERLGVDLPLQVVPIARVSGVVLGLDGRPSVSATVTRVPSQLAALTPGAVVTVRTDAGGKFLFTGVTPGSYALLARGSAARAEPGVAQGVVAAPPLSWASSDLIVAGQDVADISMTLQPGASVSGRIVVGGASPRQWTTGAVRVYLQTTSALPLPVQSNAVVGEDGTFRHQSVAPGSYRMSVALPALPGSPWAAASAVHEGRDLMDIPVEIRAGVDISDVVVTITDVQARLSGTLVDAAGRPAPQLYVFVFSTDRAHWASGGRRIRSVRATDAGAYEIGGLPPGEYYLCALTELDTMLQFESEYLGQLVPVSIRIALAEGEKKTQNLRIGR